MTKFSIDFEGLDDMVDALASMEGGLQAAANDALKATHEIVTPKAEAAIARHQRTGRTAGSVYGSPSIKWEGAFLASVDVGFAIHKGGLASVFLMWGTPRVPADPAFHAAFYGQDAAIAEAQRAAFEKVLTHG